MLLRRSLPKPIWILRSRGDLLHRHIHLDGRLPSQNNVSYAVACEIDSFAREINPATVGTWWHF